MPARRKDIKLKKLVKNLLRDKARCTEYVIFAGRKLSREEMIRRVAQYLGPARVHNPPRNTTVRLSDTKI